MRNIMKYHLYYKLSSENVSIEAVAEKWRILAMALWPYCGESGIIFSENAERNTINVYYTMSIISARQQC